MYQTVFRVDYFDLRAKLHVHAVMHNLQTALIESRAGYSPLAQIDYAKRSAAHGHWRNIKALAIQAE
jgi:hypothetical protein